MVPKIIHYCWFGNGPLPAMAIRCINSWRKYLPEYEIWQWNEDGEEQKIYHTDKQQETLINKDWIPADKYMPFNVNAIQYIKDAYSKRKFAFVSDYARFWIIYNYGGVYFDIDVLVVRNMDAILESGPYMGLEHEATESVGIVDGANLGLEVATGLGCSGEKGMHFYKLMLDNYKSYKFIFPSGAINTKTVVSYVSENMLKLGAKRINQIQEVDGIKIYPRQYFCPVIKDGEPILEPETYTAHLYASTWVTGFTKFKRKYSKYLSKILPLSFQVRLRKLYRYILRKD